MTIAMGVVESEVLREPVGIVEFPRYAGAANVYEYMMRAPSMRAWVIVRLAHLSGRGECGFWVLPPQAEDVCQILAEHYAIQEVQRPLRRVESKLLQQSVRDVRLAWNCMMRASMSAGGVE